MNSFSQFSFKPSYYAEFRVRLLSNFSAVHRVSGIKIPIAFYAFSLTTLQTPEHQSCSAALNSSLKKYLTTLSYRSCSSPSVRHACLLSYEAVPTEINSIELIA